MRGLVVAALIPIICAVVVGCRPRAESTSTTQASDTAVSVAGNRLSTSGVEAGQRRRTPGGPDVINVAPTPTLTQRPRTPTPEPDYVTTLTSAEEPRTLSTTESSDGNWRTEVIRYECMGAQFEEKAYEELLLIDLGTGIAETVDTQLQNCGGLGASGLRGLFWSPSNQYFYYTGAAEGVPDGCGYWFPPYRYLHLASRETGEIGGGARSPDDRLLAAWQGVAVPGTDQWRVDLVIWDIDQGELTRFPDISEIGAIAWSPTGAALAYLQSTWECGGQTGHFTVTLVDLAAGTRSPLITADEPSIYAVAWTVPGQMTLTDTDYNEWILTLANQELRAAPASAR